MPGGLVAYRSRQPYVLIDEARLSARALAAGQNLAAAHFRLEQSRTPADVQGVLAALVAWLQDPAHESVRRAEVEHLPFLGDSRAPKVLSEALFEDVQMVRAAAAAAA